MKKYRTIDISYDNLGAIIKKADDVISQNPDMTYNNFYIDYSQNGWGNDVDIFLEYCSEETEEEKTKRLKEEAERKARQEERDREKYLELKKKFEGESA